MKTRSAKIKGLVLLGVLACSGFVSAADFTSVSHKLFVNSGGDVYLQAQDRIVLIHGDIAIPITLDPTESSYWLERDSNETHGYKAAVTYDEVNSPLDVSSYTEHDGLEIFSYNGGNDLFIPDVGAMPHSIVLDGGATNATLIASDVNLQSGYLIATPQSPQLGDGTVEVTVAERNATDAVGSIAGQFSVSPSGAANYNIPIYTPQGSGGVAPQLSLNYSSASASGIVGYGWNIGGLSTITRCRQTLQQDTLAFPVKFSDEDRFCLDGQRLLLIDDVTYDYGDIGSEYRTEIDGFATVRALGGSTDGDPEYFEVKRKDGSVSYYGNTGDSSSDTATGETLTWGINEFEDNVGNNIIYEYDDSPQGDGHMIASVKYGNGISTTTTAYNARIEFEYENRDDRYSGFVSNSAFSSIKRLQRIEVHNTVGSSESQVRQYNFNYDEPGLGASSDDGLARLTSVEECVSGSSTSSGVGCLPKTTFEWEVPQLGSNGSAISETLSGSQLAYKQADINGDGLMDIIYLDNNRDLRYVVADSTTSYSTGVFTNSALVLDVGATGNELEVLDYNADGRQDVAVFCNLSAICSTPDRWQVYISVPQTNGDWKLSATSIALDDLGSEDTIFFSDFNSDGLIDATNGPLAFLVEDGSQGVGSSTPYKFGTSIPIKHGASDPYTPNQMLSIFQVGDFNADGKVDFAGVSESCPPGTTCYTFNRLGAIADVITVGGVEFQDYAPTSGAYGNGGRLIVDLNHDGLSDEVYEDNNDWYYRLSKGDVTGGAGVSAVSFEVAVLAGPSYWDIQLGDYNNDGYADIYWVDTSNDRLYIKYWDTLNGGFTSTTYTAEVGGSVLITNDNDDYLIQDMNSDGLADIVHISSSNLDVYYHLDTGDIPNKIVQIIDGLGAETDITYESIGTSDHYAALKLDTSPASTWKDSEAVSSSSALYTQINQDYSSVLPSGSDTLQANERLLQINSGIQVVTEVSSSSPVESNASAKSDVSYYYGRALAQAGGRGFLGFAKHLMVDEQRGIETLTTYRQDWPFIGAPLKIESRTSAGDLISETDHSWTVRTQDSDFDTDGSSWESDMQTNGSADVGPLATYIERSVVKTYDPYDGTSVALSTVVTDVVRDGYGNPDLSTVRTYAGDESDPISADYVNQVETDNKYFTTGSSLTLEYIETMGRVRETEVTTTRKDSGTNETSVRKVTFDYYDADDLIPSGGPTDGTYSIFDGMLRAETVYLDSAALTYTEHYYDGHGNLVMSRVDGDANDDGTDESRYSARTEYDSDGRYVDVTYDTFDDGTGSADEEKTSEVISRNNYGAATEARTFVGTGTGDYITSKNFTTDRGLVYFSTDSTGAWTAATLIDGANSTYCPSGTEYAARVRTATGGEAYECFDILGRSIGKAAKEFDGTYAYTHTFYDDSGRVVKTSEPAGSNSPTHWAVSIYDDLGRLTDVNLPGVTNDTTYDYEGLQTLTTTPRGNTKREVRNVLGEIVSVYENKSTDVTAVDGNALTSDERSETHYLYDAAGNMVTMTDDASNVTTISYDNLGRKEDMIDPDKGFWQYEYNDFGELICQIDAKGQIIKNQYDFAGRMVQRLDYESGGNCASPSGTEVGYTVWEYDQATDGLGQLNDVAQYSSSTDTTVDYLETYHYDSLGRSSEKLIEIDGNSDAHWSKTTYDQYGRIFQSFDAARDSRTYTDNGTQHDYNGNGYLEKITDVRYSGSNPLSIYYEIDAMDERGNVTEALYGNSIDVYAGYEADTGYLDWLAAKGAVTYQNYDLQWDEVGNLDHRMNLTGTSAPWGTGGSVAIESETFAYDGMNRLTDYSVSTNTESIEYNSIGNIVSKSDFGSADYVYGTKPSLCSSYATPGPHAVSVANSIDYCYDANGNMVKDSNRDLNYTVYDMVESIDNGTYTTSFKYGPDRGRYEREDTDGTETTTTHYVGSVQKITYDDGSIEWKRDIAGIGQITQEVNSTGFILDETTHYFLKDHLGSITHILEMGSSVTVTEMAFDPWGARREDADWQDLLTDLSGFYLTGASAGSSPTTSKGFTGHEMLDEVGIIHMNGRIFDAKLARFAQADPIVQAPFTTASLNRYSYTWNNPMNATDPSGYQSWFDYAGPRPTDTVVTGQRIYNEPVSNYDSLYNLYGNSGPSYGIGSDVGLGSYGLGGDRSGAGNLSISSSSFSSVNDPTAEMAEGLDEATEIPSDLHLLFFQYGLTDGTGSNMTGGKFGSGLANLFSRIMEANRLADRLIDEVPEYNPARLDISRVLFFNSDVRNYTDELLVKAQTIRNDAFDIHMGDYDTDGLAEIMGNPNARLGDKAAYGLGAALSAFVLDPFQARVYEEYGRRSVIRQFQEKVSALDVGYDLSMFTIPVDDLSYTPRYLETFEGGYRQ